MEKWAPGSHANTFGGNPLCCAAALATLDLVRSSYADNAQRMGQRIMERLAGLAKQFEFIGEVRGRGLMIGIEFVSDRVTKAPAKKLASKIVHRAFHNGLLLLECGASGIRLIPPLMIDAALVDEGLAMLERSLQEAQAEMR
jgi:4-aminobutyrate aminotransferase